VTKQRLQKFLADAGLGSRRKNEEYIRSQRVSVNGRVALLGQSVDPAADEIYFDGERVHVKEHLIYIMLNKPTGVLSSTVRQGGHPTILDLVRISERVYPVGRLDLESRGLILLTNNGEITHRLTHPKFGHEKEYRVLLNRQPDSGQLAAWRRGVVLPGGQRTAGCVVRRIKHSGPAPWLKVILKQGYKRQIRETANVIGLTVVDLIRTRIGPLELGELETGAWRNLNQQEIDALHELS
jgi:23S rRNA pseudouridine2605 synthase